jgi:hypothetical protein
LSHIHFANAEKIVLVDDTNTQAPVSLYKAFPPQKARRLVERLEWHYGPKHGRWLNLAEAEMAVLCRHCLAWRIEDPSLSSRRVAAWLARRNASLANLNWRFTILDARIKLKSERRCRSL